MIKDLKKSKIAIVGLGEENYILAKYFIQHGIKFTVYDQKDIKDSDHYDLLKKYHIDFQFGEDYLDNLNNYEIVYRTPGLPFLNEKIQLAKKLGVEISSQTKLFFDLCPCKIVGVTGTKGKGTTSSLIYNILKLEPGKKRQNVYLGGNIGNAPIGFLDKLESKDIVILELSSFQLQDLKKSPHIAVVLDIKSDHLDYHSGQNEYIEAKKMIVEHQTKEDFVVVNADYLTSFEFGLASLGQTYFFSRQKSVDLGTYIQKDKIILRTKDKEYEICNLTEIQLLGSHNLENICAAITASYLAGANIEFIKKTVKEFKGLEHRLELVDEINDVKYYNDSFSTTPETTIAALLSFKEPIILLLGGSEKKSNYEELTNVISKSSVKLIIPIGLTAERIVSGVKNDKIQIIDGIKSMQEAINIAKNNTSKGDIVLLSPASASFDRYKNYKERGNIFKSTILK